MTENIYIPGISKPSVQVTVEIEAGTEAHVITLLEAALNNLKHRSEAERNGIGHDTKVFDYGHYTILHKVER
jgi:hypothetical protein